jgi:hypothetical protein
MCASSDAVAIDRGKICGGIGAVMIFCIGPIIASIRVSEHVA